MSRCKPAKCRPKGIEAYVLYVHLHIFNPLCLTLSPASFFFFICGFTFWALVREAGDILFCNSMSNVQENMKQNNTHATRVKEYVFE